MRRPGCQEKSGPKGSRGIQSRFIQEGEDHTLFIEYPKCATCQKARKWLETNGVSFQSRHIKEAPPTLEELKIWHTHSGLPLKRFFNTSGLKYKELGLKNKLPGMSEEEQLSLLASDGMLVKRPLLVGDNFVLAGFREAEWSAALRK